MKCCTFGRDGEGEADESWWVGSLCGEEWGENGRRDKGFHFDHAQAQILDGSIQWGLLIIDQTLSDDEDEQRLQVLRCFG